jgi:PiT family inorganic phosphate transporter
MPGALPSLAAPPVAVVPGAAGCVGTAAGAVGALAALVATLGVVGIIIDTIAGVVVIATIFLWSRRSEVSPQNVVSEVADSGRAVKIKRNPKPKKQVTR